MPDMISVLVIASGDTDLESLTALKGRLHDEGVDVVTFRRCDEFDMTDVAGEMKGRSLVIIAFRDPRFSSLVRRIAKGITTTVMDINDISANSIAAHIPRFDGTEVVSVEAFR